MKTLVIFSHPTFDKSTANKVIMSEYRKSKYDITIRHLEEIYSGYEIDIKAEQQALLDADTIILQFPFYWYASPPALKNWIDQVFGFNFAYGPEGDKLKGKNLIISTTIGGQEISYNPLGYNHFKVEDFLKPFEQTAYLSKLNYIKPVYTHGLIYIPNVYNIKEEVEDRARHHVQKVFAQLDELVMEN